MNMKKGKHMKAMMNQLKGAYRALTSTVFTLVAAILFAGLPKGAVAAVGSCAPVTFPGATEGVNLSGFPVGIRFSEGNPSGFSYEGLTADSIIVYADDGAQQELPCDIEWNPGGVSVAWVKIP